MKKAVYPGVFDPITYGHIDLIKRALIIFDQIIVAVAENPLKKPLFSKQEGLMLTTNALTNMQNVEVKSFDGLLIDFLEKEQCNVILRGLREISDFQYEFQQAIMNKKLNKKVETVFMMTGSEYFYLSSTLVKELALLNADISSLVPREIELALKKKMKSFQKT